MAKTSSEVQEIYIGLLGRAADAEGLAYWTTGGGAVLTVEDLRANIVNLQPEYISGMGAMTRGEVVTELYSNLFNRAPDNEGYAYWVSGEGSSVNVDQLVLGLTNGASDADLATVANKVTAAEYYTENAAVYSAAEATAAVADVDATAASLTASQAATNAIEAPAAPTTPISGQTFTLTANQEDDLVGTSGDDVFNATNQTVHATDKVNGGSGEDVLEIRATGNIVAADISGVESINVYGDSFSAIAFDAAETNDATITMIKGANGMSSSATVSNAGDNTVVAGSGISGTLTVTGSDEGAIHVGKAATIALDVTAATNDLVFVVTDDSDAELDDGAGTASTATAIEVSGGTGTIDAVALDAAGTAGVPTIAIEDVTLADGAKLILDVGQVAATLAAEGNGILELFSLDATADGTFDLEDSDDTVSFSIGDLGTNNITLNNADGKTIILNHANVTGAGTGDLIVDTSDEDTGADIYVSVKKANANLQIGTNTDNTYMTLDSATARDFRNLDIDGDVYLDAKDVKLRIDAATELDNDADVTARLIVSGENSMTLENIDIYNLDASAVTGNISASHDGQDGSAKLFALGSGDDIFSAVATGTDILTVKMGGGNDTVIASANNADHAYFGEDGNDLFIYNAANVGAGTTNNMSFIGGSGTDTVKLTSNAGTALSLAAGTTKAFFESVEALSINGTAAAGTITLAADQLSGDKTTVSGTSSSNEDNLIIASDSNDHTIDLSTLTINSTLDSLTIDLSTTNLRDDKAITVTTTAAKETITVDVEANKGLTLNAGAGNDTIDIEQATLTETMTITLGAGKDTVDFDLAANGTSSISTASDRFIITDFSLADDTLHFSSGGAVAADTVASVDVTSDTSEADSDIQASINDGLITLDGDDKANVNSLSEWVNVAEAVIGTNLAVAGFVYDGNTYVVENLAAGTVANVVQLTGVTTTVIGTGAGVVSVDFT